jgi:hypothetical protein
VTDPWLPWCTRVSPCWPWEPSGCFSKKKRRRLTGRSPRGKTIQETMVWDYFIYFAPWQPCSAGLWAPPWPGRDHKIARTGGHRGRTGGLWRIHRMIWVALERPPLRTMRDRRLWIQLLPATGRPAGLQPLALSAGAHLQHPSRHWCLCASTSSSPRTTSKTLIPALQIRGSRRTSSSI